MFFKIHGQIQYEVNGNEMPLTDITKTSIIIDSTKVVLQSVDVNARTPEQLSDDIYGDPKYFWTILLINNIINPFIDWYMIEDHLYDYAIRLYGEDHILDVKYFENTDTKEIITGDDAERFLEMMENDIPLPEYIMYVTNLDYEKIKNENKKIVNIIPPSSINRFVEDVKSILKGR